MPQGTITSALDALLTQTTQRHGGVPGVVAMVTDRDGNFYEGAAGTRELGQDQPMTTDAVFAIFSTTKALTGACVMQLVEEGKIRLDDPAGRYVPEIDELQVLDGFDAAGQPRTRPPKRAITVNDLMLHTSGLAYEFFSADDLAYRTAKGIPTVVGCDFASIRTVLVHEPGAAWTYGPNIDWLGRIVEQQRGQRLGAVMAERIFGPLGMKDTAFWVAPDKVDRLAANYQRGPDKKLKLIDDPATSAYTKDPAFKSGGGGLTGTIADYMKFCEMLRRGGELDGHRVIGPRTLAMMHMNHLAGGKDLTQMAIGSFSETSNEGVGFGLGFASTMDEVSTGSLGAGDYYWGGAASTIFLVDPKEDLTMVFMTQLMPSGTFNFRGQLKSLIYSAIVD